MAALGGGRDGRQLSAALSVIWRLRRSASELSGAEPGHSEPGPGSLITPHFLSLRGSQSRLLARDLILVLAVLCSPPCVIMLHKSKKQHVKAVEDGE